MIPRIAHANIRVKDPRMSVAFYRHLGLDIAGCLNISPGYYLIYLAPAGDDQCTLELTVNEKADAAYDRSPGSGHIALAVGNLDGLVERLNAAGIVPEAPPFHPAGPEGPRVCFVKDPDGVRVELIDGAFPTPQNQLPIDLAN